VHRVCILSGLETRQDDDDDDDDDDDGGPVVDDEGRVPSAEVSFNALIV